jgi:hypothetical protein
MNKQGPNFTRILEQLCLDKAGKTFPFGQEFMLWEAILSHKLKR